MLIVQVFHEESLLSITYNCNKLQPFQLELSVAGSCPGQEQPLLSPQSQEMWSQCFSCLACLCKRLCSSIQARREGAPQQGHRTLSQSAKQLFPLGSRSLQESGQQEKPQLFPCQDGYAAPCLIPDRHSFTGTYAQCYFARIMMNGRSISPCTWLPAHTKSHCNFSYVVLIPFGKLSTKTEKKTNNLARSRNIILTCLLDF